MTSTVGPSDLTHWVILIGASFAAALMLIVIGGGFYMLGDHLRQKLREGRDVRRCQRQERERVAAISRHDWNY